MAVLSAVCVFRREKMHWVWEYPLLILRYPIILSELCSSYEQFVNDFLENRLLKFLIPVICTSDFQPQPVHHTDYYTHSPHAL